MRLLSFTAIEKSTGNLVNYGQLRNIRRQRTYTQI